MSRCVVTILVAIATAACSIDVRGQETVAREERRFAVDGPVEVVLRTFDGALDVRSWDRAEVLVEIERRAATPADAQALDVRTSQEAGRLTIEAPNPQRGREGGVVHLGSWRSPSVSFVVTLPRRATLRANSGDGAIAVRDVTGTVALETADGSVRAERVEGELSINTGDGAVAIRDLQGGLDLHTGDGAVEVTGRLDALRIDTGDGSIRLEAHQGSAMKSEWTVHTGDGAITVRLPAEFNAELDTVSGDGRITVSGIANATSSDRNDGPARLNVRLGIGGPALRVRTGDGPITVTR